MDMKAAHCDSTQRNNVIDVMNRSGLERQLSRPAVDFLDL